MKWFMAAAAFVVSSNIDIFLARKGLSGSGIHVGLGLSILAAAAAIGARQASLGFNRFSGIALPFACLLMWSLVTALFSIDIELSLLTIARYFSIGVAMLLLASLAGQRVDFDRSLAFGLAAGLVVVWLSIVTDAFQPGTFSRQATRAAGLYINPNGAAHALVLTYIALLAVWRRSTFNGWMAAAYLIVATGVFLTLSRSGIVLLGILTIGLSVIYFSMRFAIYTAALTIVGTISILMFGHLGEVSQFQNVTTMNRLDRLFTVEAYLDQNDARVQLLRSYLSDRVGFVGSGPGVSSRLSTFGGATHNTYAKLYWESGLVAVLLYLAVLLAPFRRTLARGTFMTVAIVAALGVFTNYNLDNRLVYLSLLLALATAQKTNIQTAYASMAGTPRR